MTIALLALLAAPPLAGPPLPYFDWGACPFECCVYGQWRANRAVKVYRDRSTRSPVAFTVEAGQKVQALTGVVVTWRPTRLRFRAARVLVDEEGEGAPAARAEAGDVVYLLTSRGEGYFGAWFKGRLFRSLDASFLYGRECEPTTRTETCPVLSEKRGRSTWWVKLRDAAGRVGWTAEAEAFEDNDACG